MLYSKLYRFYLVIFLMSLSLFAKERPTCLYINSYHVGFSWSDKLEKSLKNVLKDTCEIVQINMDTKRNKNEEYIKQKAIEVRDLIYKVNPDIVIASDDNASKFVIKPYFKNSDIPFIFCGINWTAKEYGFPYKNVTGMIEVIPINELYSLAKNLISAQKALFIGDDTLTDKKDLSHFIKLSSKHNIKLESALVNTSKEWMDAYIKGQDYDFIILGHNSAVKNWDDKEIKKFLENNSNKLVLTTYNWMMPYSMIGLTIKAQEQGTWAGNSAKAVLDGFPIEDINITVNKTWESTINQKLISLSNIKLPRDLIVKSKKLNMD